MRARIPEYTDRLELTEDTSFSLRHVSGGIKVARQFADEHDHFVLPRGTVVYMHTLHRKYGEAMHYTENTIRIQVDEGGQYEGIRIGMDAKKFNKLKLRYVA